MINPDLTEVLSRYCEWDDTIRNQYLKYAASMMKEHHRVIFKNIEYHNVADLKADLEAECIEAAKQS